MKRKTAMSLKWGDKVIRKGVNVALQFVRYEEEIDFIFAVSEGGMEYYQSRRDFRRADHPAALKRLAEAAELRKIIEKPEEVGLWEPKHGGDYWRVSSDGVSEVFCNKYDPFDIALIEHGNVFPTEPIARKASALQRKFNFYLQACFQADPDAGEWSEERPFGIYLNSGGWGFSFFTSVTDSVCVHAKEQAAEVFRLLNAWQAKEDAK